MQEERQSEAGSSRGEEPEHKSGLAGLFSRL